MQWSTVLMLLVLAAGCSGSVDERARLEQEYVNALDIYAHEYDSWKAAGDRHASMLSSHVDSPEHVTKEELEKFKDASKYSEERLNRARVRCEQLEKRLRELR